VFPEHFAHDIPPDVARALFKRSVRKVELEPFTFCNRVCWFCANARIDRRSANRYMDEGLYLRILSDLRDIGYDRSISYCRYNEPLADRIILTRIRQARAVLPDVHIFTHSNGDYLTRKLLDELREAGLNRLRVQVYLGPNESFSDAAMLRRMRRRLGDLGLPYEFTDASEGDRYEAKVRYDGIAVTFEGWNYDKHANDRAQSIAVRRLQERTAPCLIPFTDVYIDHDGTVAPCCNIRSDEPTHLPYLIGALSADTSIFDLFASRRLADWRKALFPFGPKARPCNSCGHATIPDTPENRDAVGNVARGAGIAPLDEPVEPDVL
jgi:MoaA/NifB/PqqE/SkfB family radical SAM enzyme